jgi:hypothetical protein
MGLSTAATAGIVVAVLILLSITFGTILFRNRRHRHVSKGLDDESPTMNPEGDASPSMSPPTLTGPKKRLHENHHRYPSLENGPGPTIIKKPRSKLFQSVKNRPSTPSPESAVPSTTPNASATIPSTPVTTATATPSTTATVLHTVRPSTSGTHRPSSLHQAVLGKQEEAMVEAMKREEEKMKADVEANMGLKREGDAKARRYTGAWP